MGRRHALRRSGALLDGPRIYLKLIRISLQSLMQYRTDFAIGVIGVVAMNAVNLGLIGILVSRFVHLGGWTVWQLVFLYSLWILGHSIYSTFFWHLSALENYVVDGTFDQSLTRPLSPLLQLLGREIHHMGVADLLVGVAGLTLAYSRLDLHWTLSLWAFFFLAVAAGATIETSLEWLVACLAFWTGRSATAAWVVARLNVLVQQYPVDIFGQWFRVIVTGIVPVAFMNYYPALVLLGKAAPRGPRAWLGYASPVVALCLLGIATAVWHLGLKRYSSSGS